MSILLQSVGQSALGAFIHSGLQGRGFPSGGIGDLVFVGRFGMFGGVTRRKVAVWRAATQTYDSDTDWGFTSGDLFRATVVGSTLYVASGVGVAQRIWRADTPGYTHIHAASADIRDMCAWNGDLIFGTNNGLWRWDGSSVTQIPNDPRWSTEIWAYASCRVGQVDGVDVLVVLAHESPEWTEGDADIFVGYYDGTDWAYPEDWIGGSGGATTELESTMIQARSIQPFTVIDGLFYFFAGSLNAGASTHIRGTNKHSQIQVYDPVANTVTGWCEPADPGSLDIATFTVGTFPSASVGLVGGSLLLAGKLSAFEPKGGSSTTATDTEGCTPTTFGAGANITDYGGWRAMSSTHPPMIHQVAGSHLLCAIYGTDAGVISQFGGGTVDGGASRRLATFDGAAWASWPEQPDSGVTHIHEAPNLTI